MTRYDPAANVCNGEPQSACISKAGTPIETAAELASVGNWQTIEVGVRQRHRCRRRHRYQGLFASIDRSILPFFFPPQDFQLQAATFLPVALSTPTVVASGRAHFGCDSLMEVPLEAAGGLGSAGSHWEARILERDVMTPVIVDEMIFSELDGAVANDSGWYIVDDEIIGG